MSMSLFNAARGYVEAQTGQIGKKGDSQAVRPCVTISREAGAGGVGIAQKAAEELQRVYKNSTWAVFDKNLVERVIADHELPVKIKQFMTDDMTSGVASAVEELLGLHPSEWEMVHHTTDTILRLAKAGNVVLVGRGSSLITAHMKQAFHVRLVAPFGQRVRHQAQQLQLSEREAAELVRKTDRARERYVKCYFEANARDPLLYHITINTGLTGEDAAVALIVQGVLNLKI